MAPRGYPPYHPALMTKLLLYGYATGVYSSLDMEGHVNTAPMFGDG